MNLCEAFRALNALNEDTFSVDADGINKLSAFEQSDDLTDEISIIDPDAETEEELSDSYVGKVILDCCVCHSKLYKSKDEVTLDDEGLMANVGEECPYCYTPDGFKVIGEVAPFDNEDSDNNGGADEVEEGLLGGDVNVKIDGSDSAVGFLGGSANTTNESLQDGIFNPNKKKGATKDRADMKQTAIRPSAALDWDEETKFIKDDTYPMQEASAVATRPSIASVLSKNMDSLYSYDNASELRNAIMDIVTNSEVDPKEVSKLQRALFSKKSVSALLSTIGTYMTGERVVDTTGRNAEMNNAVNESKSIDEDTEVLTVGKLTRLVKKLTGLDTYKTHSTSIRGYRSPGEGSFQVTKEGFNSFRIIFYRNKEMQQKVKDELISQGYNVYDMANDIVVDASKCVTESKSINESVNNITIETDEDTVDVAMDGNGGVTVNATPTSAADSGDEVIVPVSDETMTEIEGNDEPIEEPTEGDEMDVNIDEFDEESFDELGESYFKRIYENVNGYKTTSIKESNNQLIVEGTLKFNSGNLKKTSFVFEALDIDKNGRARFVGDNKQITEGKKAFTLVGKVRGNKFITESMNYNYRDKGTNGKTTRVYGNARVSKRG